MDLIGNKKPIVFSWKKSLFDKKNGNNWKLGVFFIRFDTISCGNAWIPFCNEKFLANKKFNNLGYSFKFHIFKKKIRPI